MYGYFEIPIELSMSHESIQLYSQIGSTLTHSITLTLTLTEANSGGGSPSLQVDEEKEQNAHTTKLL